MKFALAIAALTATAASVSAFSTHSRNVAFACNTRTTPLFGILDEINGDSFDLLGGGKNDSGGGDDAMDKAYETFLGQLVFSANDPRLDIIDNIELCSDPVWLNWLQKKVDTTTDVEEKMALRDLKAMIDDIVKRMELSKATEEREAKEKEEAEVARLATAETESDEGRKMSDTDVLRKASSVDRSGLGEAADVKVEKVSFYEQELTPEIRMSYDDMVKKVLPPYKPGDSPTSTVFSYYDQFDAQFIKVLRERSDNGETESQDILDALSVEQGKRVEAATKNIKEVLSAGDPMRMEGFIVKMAKQGIIDEPFLLLLEANANQAAAAGAQGPAQLMKRLGQRAMEEKDKQSQTKEIKLLRQLLRTDDSTKREELLTDAFTPKQGLIVSIWIWSDRISSSMIVTHVFHLVLRLKGVRPMQQRLWMEKLPTKKNQCPMYLLLISSMRAKQCY
jgi:hypothetical protein